jgi:hypothetical protein
MKRAAKDCTKQMFCQKASLFALAIARCTFLRKMGSPISVKDYESNRLTQFER